MRQTSARQLLDGWDTVRGEAMPVRAAALAALGSGVPCADVMQWSVARRDRALFDLRARLFGDAVDATVGCPSCAEQLEMTLALSQLRPDDDMPASMWREVLVDGVPVPCRMPTSDDLVAIAACGDVPAARALLLAACIGAADPQQRELAAALLASEPTDVQLAMRCPACGHEWQAPFDIALFVWNELDEWARSTLRDIHVIASAYGWSEDEILRLPARRRAAYIEMIR
ncbi:MAG TPA: hypothetical protein VM032_19015 [Vicinamibacterales bacterium]|nr:hypothetical protein [Vicinamibacterales bacterium]